MKIRVGFVTNSSSTSYTVIIEKEYFNEIINKFSPFTQAVCKALADSEPHKFLGKDVIVLTWGSGNNDTIEYLDVDTDPTDEETDEAENEGYDPKNWAVQKFETALTDDSRYLLTTADS
jgi:hypothetical protein